MANGTEKEGMMNTTDLLSRLKGVKRIGDNGWLALCPGHDDHEPSLSIKEVDGKILVKCFAGCELDAILKTLGLEVKDLFADANSPVGSAGIGQGCQPVQGVLKQAQTTVDTKKTSSVNSPAGLTLAALAEAKRLPVDFLRSLGVSDFKLGGTPVVRIPYQHDGNEQVRFRLALSAVEGTRFKWRRGDHAALYGIDRLGEIRKAAWVVVVEGESDAWTCWYHGIPALGAPGKATWNPDWGQYLAGLEVYVWQEPDAQDFTLRVLRTAPDLKYIAAPDGIKDISEAHMQGRDVRSWLEVLKAGAESGKTLKERLQNADLAAAYEQARCVIEAEDPLEIVAVEIRRLGYGGDLKPAIIVYVAATSRLLEMRPGSMPVHLLLIGPPSSGKNYTMGRVLILLPRDAVHVIDAGSPSVLIYDDADLRHKIVVFSEADSLPAGEDNPVASAIRNLLQDHHLHYVVTVRDPATGKYGVHEVDKEGPTTLMTTSTRSLGEQLMTRLFTLEIADTKQHIGAALEMQAALETDGFTEPDAGFVAFQHYLQLRAPAKVSVPFAKKLGAAMAKTAAAPRVLRDFARLISMVKAVALIRQYHRHVDDRSRVVATIDDYAKVRELVNDMYVDSSTGAADDIRKLVEAVIALDGNRVGNDRITNTTLSKHLGIGVKQAERRAKRAVKSGWLVNREQRKSYPADYAPGEALPADEGLPSTASVVGSDMVDNEHVQDSSFEEEGVDRLTPATDCGVPSPHQYELCEYPSHSCPKCGSEWAVSPDGRQYLCPDCGFLHPLLCELCGGAGA